MLSEILKAADLHMNPFLCKCLCSCFSSLMACDCRAVLHTGGSPAEEPCLWPQPRPLALGTTARLRQGCSGAGPVSPMGGGGHHRAAPTSTCWAALPKPRSRIANTKGVLLQLRVQTRPFGTEGCWWAASGGDLTVCRAHGMRDQWAGVAI